MLGTSKLFWKLFGGTILLIVLTLIACTWVTLKKVDQFNDVELTRHLTAQAETIRYAIQDRFDREHAAELDRFAKQCTSTDKRELRITMILADGTVIADSAATSSKMELHNTRPEVQEALANGIGQDSRHSRTVLHAMKYLAVRLGPPLSPKGVIRVSMPVRTISERRDDLQELIWTIAIVGLAGAAIFALGLAGLWSRPIHRITIIARSISRGDLTARAHVKGNDELAVLARSLNDMRTHLLQQFEAIDKHRQTLNALLHQLTEGIVVVGPDARVLLVNPAATQLLQIPIAPSQSLEHLSGLAIEKVVTQHELQRMLIPPTDLTRTAGRHTGEKASSSPMDNVRINVLTDAGEKTLLARASDIALPALRSADEPTSQTSTLIGRVVVVTDITEIEKLVQMKTDFASNASHELRTPLATIRTAIETLLNMDLANQTDAASRFLKVIDRQETRMEQMVTDLLDLSRIESARSQFEPKCLDLATVFNDMHARYAERLEIKKLSFSRDIPHDCRSITTNPYLLQTVLGNLIDNAIKFTDTGGSISVTCTRHKAMNEPTGVPNIAITIADTGCGIAPAEQERVFERFYQTEKSRTGVDTGTGLGLSIVRHATSAMNGMIDLKSELGKGTCITITLPQRM